MDDDFAREVLRLAQGQTIECYDNQVKQQAQLLGISLAAEKLSDNSKPTSPTTYISQARRSFSNESQASQSTGLTSNLSRTSREHEALLFPTPRSSDRRISGTSVSIKDYDSILSHAKHDYHRLSLSFSPIVTPSPSTFSLPLPLPSSRDSSPRRHLIRSLSRLRLHRRSGSSSSGLVKTDDCPHCPHDSLRRHRRPSHTLTCGHSYCTPALRKVIQKAIQGPADVPPTCCNRPIPGRVIERVLNHEEQDKLMSKMVAWDTDAGSDDSSPSTTHADLAPIRDNQRKSRPSRQSFTFGLDVLAVQEARENLTKAMELPTFKTMREEQEGQRNRCVELDRSTRQTLSEESQTKKLGIMHSHDAQREALVEKHALNISQVEDKHVQDEMHLRAIQDTEVSNTATALRHMEAYCRGETTSGEMHNRIVSEQDRGELAKTRQRGEQLHKKHESEINVLRGEQNRRMTMRMQKQQAEINQLESKQTRELGALQEQCEGAANEWEDHIEAMKGKMQEWWQLQTDIWRKMLEKETGIAFHGPLPSVEWPDEDCEDAEDERRDVLNELSTGEGARRGREGSSPRPPSPTMNKEIGISTTFAVRGSVVGQS